MRILKQLPILLIVALTMTGCNKTDTPDTEDNITDNKEVIESPVEEAPEEEIEETQSIKYVTESGTVRIGSNGSMRIEGETKAPITIDYFFDPACDNSAMYNQQISEAMQKRIEDGDIEVVFRPIPYLNDKTIDDYSNRASAYILAVSEYAPTKAYIYIQKTLTTKFQPNPAEPELTDDVKFVEAMEESGLSRDEIKKVNENKEDFVSRAIVARDDFFDINSSWINYASEEDDDGEIVLATPFLLINKTGKYTSMALTIGDTQYEENFNAAIDEVKEEVLGEDDEQESDEDIEYGDTEDYEGGSNYDERSSYDDEIENQNEDDEIENQNEDDDNYNENEDNYNDDNYNENEDNYKDPEMLKDLENNTQE